MGEDDRRRRRDAKRVNERLKLVGAALNGLAVATMFAGAILPLVAAANTSAGSPLPAIGGSLMFHLAAQGVLTFWRSED